MHTGNNHWIHKQANIVISQMCAEELQEHADSSLHSTDWQTFQSISNAQWTYYFDTTQRYPKSSRWKNLAISFKNYFAQHEIVYGTTSPNLGCIRLTTTFKPFKPSNSSGHFETFARLWDHSTNMAAILKIWADSQPPVCQLLRKGNPYRWTGEHQLAYTWIMSAVRPVCETAQFNPNNHLVLKCDASHNGLGTSIEMFEDGT